MDSSTARQRRIAHYTNTNRFDAQSVLDWLVPPWVRHRKQALAAREWMFTIASHDGSGTRAIRYMAMRDAEELRAVLRELAPVRIEIGAVHTHEAPRFGPAVITSATQQRASGRGRTYYALSDDERGRFTGATVTWRELVFDIDMNDYDGGASGFAVRNCACRTAAGADGRAVCLACWRFIAVAIWLTDAILRHRCGFSDIHWHFSGRRGAHGWVRDQTACYLSKEARAGLLLGFHRMFVKEEDNDKEEEDEEDAVDRLMCAVVAPMFRDNIEPEHDVWARMTASQRHAAFASTAATAAEAESPVSVAGALLSKDEAKETFERWLLSEDRDERRRACRLVWLLVGPKLDEAVTKDVRHVVKLPWSLHPKTMRTVEPLDIAVGALENFDPSPCNERT